MDERVNTMPEKHGPQPLIDGPVGGRAFYALRTNAIARLSAEMPPRGAAIVMVQAALICSAVCAGWGCSTTRTSDTSRTGIEQLLISNAVDQALEKYDFRPLQGKAVYLDDQYLDAVDKGYLLSSIREQILYNGGRIVPKADDSDVTLEVRSGGVGTDNQELYVGIPNMSVPGLLPIEIPQIKLWNRTSQIGTAKLGILAYDTKAGVVYQQGGQSLARSDDTKWFMFGLGPFQSGSIKSEIDQSNRNPTAVARAMPHGSQILVADRAAPLATAEAHTANSPRAIGLPGPPGSFPAPETPEMIASPMYPASYSNSER